MGGRRSLIDRLARGAGADELPSGGKSVYKMAVAGKEKKLKYYNHNILLFGISCTIRWSSPFFSFQMSRFWVTFSVYV